MTIENPKKDIFDDTPDEPSFADRMEDLDEEVNKKKKRAGIQITDEELKKLEESTP